MRRKSRVLLLLLLAASVGSVTSAQPSAAQLVRQAAGASAADIQVAVDAYRADLGTLNPNVPGSFGSGRREINWDGVPDAFSAPNPFPPDFFNANTPGRARGVVFSTPGSGFQVSAKHGVAPIEFGNIHPSYPGLFAAFSPERLFTSLGSNVTEVRFFVAGSTTPATSTGFGSVFTDVDGAGTKIEYFDRKGDKLGEFPVPFIAGNETFSFLGVSFAHQVVALVRITTGTEALGHNETLKRDLVVMDDFLFGEPTH
jgi:hypothetical protein